MKMVNTLRVYLDFKIMFELLNFDLWEPIKHGLDYSALRMIGMFNHFIYSDLNSFYPIFHERQGSPFDTLNQYMEFIDVAEERGLL